MIRPLYSGILIVLSLLLTFTPAQEKVTPSKKSKKVSNIDAKEEFLAGVVILHRANLLNNTEKLQYYFFALQQITGIDPIEGRSIIASFRESPKKWDTTLKDIDTYLLEIIQQKADSLALEAQQRDSLQEITQ